MTALNLPARATDAPPAERSAIDLRPLGPGEVPALRLRGSRDLAPAAVRALLKDYPDRAVWLPTTSEFVLLAPWRHRREVAWLREIAAVGNAEALIAAAVERSRRAGDTLTLVLEMDEARRPAFYDRAGLSPLGEIVTYELEMAAARPPRGRPRLAWRRVRLEERRITADLLQIDQAAFPWLWWNAEEEFLVYDQTPGVELYLGCLDGRAIAYVGVTIYARWGHLDRVAVLPEAQGSGLGLEALAFAVATLAGRGSRRIALSTQGDNLRSQRLYERFGFVRSPSFDYRLYGAWHREVERAGGGAAAPNPSLPPHPDGSTPRLEQG